MLVQGSPNPDPKAHYHFADPSYVGPRFHVPVRIPETADEEEEVRPETPLTASLPPEKPSLSTPARRSKWSFSSLLLWNCPEFLESFPT